MLKVKKFVAIAVTAAVGLTGTAQAACWTPAAADAAHIRDLQSRLMVAALRCVKSNHDLVNEYNRFVRGKRPLISASNQVLKAHFAKGKGRKLGLKAYDRYAVSLANQYGAGSGDLSECQSMKKLAGSAAGSDSRTSSLVSLAQYHGLAPKMPGGRCGIKIASND